MIPRYRVVVVVVAAVVATAVIFFRLSRFSKSVPSVLSLHIRECLPTKQRVGTKLKKGEGGEFNKKSKKMEKRIWKERGKEREREREGINTS